MLTRDGARNGYVVVADDRIAAVSTRRPRDVPVHDTVGGVICPGLIDLHGHQDRGEQGDPPPPALGRVMMLEHRARSGHPGPFVFATRTGRAIGQRNLLRALYTAQENARTLEGRPTFPELFEHDERGHLLVDQRGEFVLRPVDRRQLKLPDFHALRHTAAMDCDDAEEARDLLRHKNSNVTRAVYRAHFSDRRRTLLRARMEARHASKVPTAPSTDRPGEVVPLDRAS